MTDAASPSEPTQATATEPAARSGLPAGAKILAIFALLGAGILMLAFNQAADVGTYSVSVADALDHDQGGRRIRVEGDLRHGSIQFREQPCEWRFTIEHDGREMPVRFPRCVVPDTFRDDYDIEVVVEGQLEDGTFLADNIIPRCPSRYEEQAKQLRQAGS